MPGQQFGGRLKARLAEMPRDRAAHEQLDVVAFLPSGQAISMDVRVMTILHWSPCKTGEGERNTLHVARASIIRASISLDRTGSIRFSAGNGEF